MRRLGHQPQGMNFAANGLLAVGASPGRWLTLKKIEGMVARVGTFVLDIGTLNGDRVDRVLRAGKSSSSRRIPVSLDPLGFGIAASGPARSAPTDASPKLGPENPGQRIGGALSVPH